MLIFPLLKRDIKLSFRKGSGAIGLLMFFVISVSLFPFGIGSDLAILDRTGEGIIWVCALLSSMLSIPYIFEEDFEDGSLSQLLLQGFLPEKIILSKIISHLIISGLPLVIVAPILAVFLNISGEKMILLLAALATGMPVLSMIGSIGAALTIGLKRGGGLISILVLPLYIPILIFGVGLVEGGDEKFLSNISIMAGLLLFMLPVSVFACSAAVKEAVGE